MATTNTKGDDPRLAKGSVSSVTKDRDESDVGRTDEDGTMLTRAERLRMIREEWSNDVLPSPPPVEGWHFCWLSTTNATDPIYKRIQKGYEPVKASEIPGWKQYRVGEGEFEGCVACNEMLLFKIPEELYQEIMHIFHYERPMDEEEILKANAKDKLKSQDSDGKELGQVEGFENLGKRIRPQPFQ